MAEQRIGASQYIFKSKEGFLTDDKAGKKYAAMQSYSNHRATILDKYGTNNTPVMTKEEMVAYQDNFNSFFEDLYNGKEEAINIKQRLEDDFKTRYPEYNNMTIENNLKVNISENGDSNNIAKAYKNLKVGINKIKLDEKADLNKIKVQTTTVEKRIKEIEKIFNSLAKGEKTPEEQKLLNQWNVIKKEKKYIFNAVENLYASYQEKGDKSIQKKTNKKTNKIYYEIARGFTTSMGGDTISFDGLLTKINILIQEIKDCANMYTARGILGEFSVKVVPTLLFRVANNNILETVKTSSKASRILEVQEYGTTNEKINFNSDNFDIVFNSSISRQGKTDVIFKVKKGEEIAKVSVKNVNLKHSIHLVSDSSLYNLTYFLDETLGTTNMLEHYYNLITLHTDKESLKKKGSLLTNDDIPNLTEAHIMVKFFIFAQSLAGLVSNPTDKPKGLSNVFIVNDTSGEMGKIRVIRVADILEKVEAKISNIVNKPYPGFNVSGYGTNLISIENAWVGKKPTVEDGKKRMVNVIKKIREKKITTTLSPSLIKEFDNE